MFGQIRRTSDSQITMAFVTKLRVARPFSSSSVTKAKQLVTFERPGDGRVGILTLDDPKLLNAMTAPMGDQFMDLVDSICQDADGLGAVVLTGQGRAFSAGGDLGFLKPEVLTLPVEMRS